MIDNRKIAEITGVWDYPPMSCCANGEHRESQKTPPDFLHDDSAFVKVLNELWLRGYVVNLRLGLAVIAKDDELVHSNVGDFKTALLLAVQQIGDSDAS